MALKLQPEQESALKAEAEAQGIITEQWLELLIEERLQSVRWPDSDEEQLQSEPFWKTFTRRMHALPTEVFDRLPADSASEHDHYLYGSRRRH